MVAPLPGLPLLWLSLLWLSLLWLWAGVGVGAEGAEGIAGAGLFDLDDLGTLLAEDAGAERGGNPGAHIEHPQPSQWLTHPGARLLGLRAI